ncbi:MAG TPA: TIGR01777 family oxidoreductase [Tepidisphaeraceae bacterium]|nr:TIGR01777 family oxidoreductase [Tepidisphaeraceae bacterium]
MTVAIAGASGMIGRALQKRLAESGHTALTIARGGGPPTCDAIVNLAGEPIAQRWTPGAKKRIHDSRVEGTRHLVNAISSLPQRPQVLVCASAVGIYGSRDDEILTETSAPGSGFLPQVVIDWEMAAKPAQELGVRVVSLRFGAVLGHGGALAKLLPVFKLGAGGRLASGHQWMSWIHIHDAVGLIRSAIENAGFKGPLNATAPNPVTNAEFTNVLAGELHRPAVFPVPAFALKLALGEMSQVLLDSQRAIPSAAQAAGFRFEYPELRPALHHILATRT